MGRTIPSWRMVVESELERLNKFRAFLRSEDKETLMGSSQNCEYELLCKANLGGK